VRIVLISGFVSIYLKTTDFLLTVCKISLATASRFFVALLWAGILALSQTPQTIIEGMVSFGIVS
jgi:hypothetical protein